MDFTGIQKKWISLVLVIIMSLSGVCLENKKADSVFGWEDIRNTSESIYVSVQTFSDEDMCTGELLGLRNADRIIRDVLRDNRRTDYKVSGFSLIPVILPGVLSYLLKSAERLEYNYTNSLSIILCYIYHQGDSKG